MRRTATLLACLLLSGLTACGSDSTDDKPTAAKSSPSASAEPIKAEPLEPVWAPKLKEAAGEEGEAISACNLPSSNACARYLGDIMNVVHGLETAIGESGREYPATKKQIATMTDAESEYTENGCQGDPTADDPNSQCHGVVNVTLGATTLSMTLYTDEAGM